MQKNGAFPSVSHADKMAILGFGRGWQLHFNYRADGFGTAPDGRAFLERGPLIASVDFPSDAG